MTGRSPRVDPIQKRAVITRAAIVKAATRVLATIGRDEFTTQDIASEARVSIGTYYRYFPDKKAILDEVWPDREDPKFPGPVSYY